jgi:protein-S-isoprenylcysteine O-methyltransferase Ste14
VSFPKPYADRVAKLRVPCGFVLVGAFLWFSRPSAVSLAWGLPVAFLGLALRAWAAGHLEKNQQLTESGPYAWVRNPLYIGTLTAAAGFVIASRRWELGALFAAVFLLVYLPVVELEEQHLRKLFPAFDEYSRRVPKLIPRAPGAHRAATVDHRKSTAWPPSRSTAKPFRWSLYLHNREYEALIGFLAGTAALLWKALR